MQELLNLLSQVVKNQEQPPKIEIKFKTTEPDTRPQFEEWCQEYNVGMLWDRSAVHLG
jgi:hypothetical protein